MRRTGKSRSDQIYLNEVGKRVAKAITDKGYESPYAFWITKCDGQISRASLNMLLVGKVDPKLTTLHAVAKLLKMKTRDLLDFE